MLRRPLAFLATTLILVCGDIHAQNIVYSQTEKISTNGNNFQVIGKFDGRILAFREMIAPEYEGYRSVQGGRTARRGPWNRTIQIDNGLSFVPGAGAHSNGHARG